MRIFNLAFGKVFELIFLPFRGASPWVGMILVSFLTGIFLLFIFRLTSNQTGIRQVKNKIKAHFLELRLFKDSFGMSLKAQGNILRSNLRYLGYSLKPLLVMIVPVILILAQLNLWFGYESLQPGEKAILKVKLKDSSHPLEMRIEVSPSSGLEVDSPPLRLEKEKELDWRLSVREKGLHDLILTLNGQRVVKKVAVSQKPLSRISPVRTRAHFIQQVLYPGEAPLPGNLPLARVEILYPSRMMNLFGLPVHWIIAYFVLSVVFGFAFKGIFKVEI